MHLPARHDPEVGRLRTNEESGVTPRSPLTPEFEHEGPGLRSHPALRSIQRCAVFEFISWNQGSGLRSNSIFSFSTRSCPMHIGFGAHRDLSPEMVVLNEPSYV